MDFELIRPICSGLIGALLAALFCRALSRWTPRVFHGKSASTLIRENHAAIWLANTLLFGGLLASIAIYKSNFLPSNDWRGFALGIGGGSVAVFAALPLLAVAAGRSPIEAYVAYAVSQKIPAVLMYGIFIGCAGSFTATAVSLFVK